MRRRTLLRGAAAAGLAAAGCAGRDAGGSAGVDPTYARWLGDPSPGDGAGVRFYRLHPAALAAHERPLPAPVYDRLADYGRRYRDLAGLALGEVDWLLCYADPFGAVPAVARGGFDRGPVVAALVDAGLDRAGRVAGHGRYRDAKYTVAVGDGRVVADAGDDATRSVDRLLDAGVGGTGRLLERHPGAGRLVAALGDATHAVGRLRAEPATGDGAAFAGQVAEGTALALDGDDARVRTVAVFARPDDPGVDRLRRTAAADPGLLRRTFDDVDARVRHRGRVVTVTARLPTGAVDGVG